MTRNPVVVRSDASLADAARAMLDNRTCSMPVLDRAGDLVGFVTDADLLRRVECGAPYDHPRWTDLFVAPDELRGELDRVSARRVDEVMSEPISIEEKMPLQAAVARMESNHIKCLPVTRDGKLCGMLRRADLMRVFFEPQTKSVSPSTVSRDTGLADGLVALAF
jgi:CBS domain-containing protein